MTARTARVALGTGTAVLAIATGLAPLVMSMPSATASGTNGKGSLTVHDATTGIEVSANQPKVCTFRLVASNYGPADGWIMYWFTEYPAQKFPAGTHLLPGKITLSKGIGQTPVLRLPDGMYKPHGQLYSTKGVLENGSDNYKVFKVECAPPPPPSPSPTPSPSGSPSPSPSGSPSPSPSGSPSPSSSPSPSGSPKPSPSSSPTVTPTTPPPSGTPTTPPPSGSPSTPPSSGTTQGGGGVTTTVTTVTSTVNTTVHTSTPAAVTHTRTLGSGHITTAVTTAKALPFTGRNTGELAAWALAAVVAGAGLVVAGQREGKHTH